MSPILPERLQWILLYGYRDGTHPFSNSPKQLSMPTEMTPMTCTDLLTTFGGPAAFKTLLSDFADYFDRAPRGAALETLQKFGVRTGTPFSSYLRALRVVVASTVEKGGPLAPSATMAIELVRIRTAQQYPTLMPTLYVCMYVWSSHIAEYGSTG